MRSSADDAIARLDALLREVARVEESEFAYPEGRDALKAVALKLNRVRSDLLANTPNASAQSQRVLCALALREVRDHLAIVGLLLRSTNVRNAFETVRPLQRLARSLLEPNTPRSDRSTRLVLSSEWEYSPFVLDRVPDLDGFVLVGLPASESGNPLLLPLAGHELGHPAWRKFSMHDHIYPSAVKVLYAHADQEQSKLRGWFSIPLSEDVFENLFARQLRADSLIYAMYQCQEMFCDLVELRLFGRGYLRAFAYLLAPQPSAIRSPRYPHIRTRAVVLANAARRFGFAPVDGFVERFDEGTVDDGRSAEARTREALADCVVPGVADLLVERAEEIARAAGVVLPTDDASEAVFRALAAGAPHPDPASLADIVNAGWLAYDAESLWSRHDIAPDDVRAVVRDIVLKCIEVLDIHQTIAEMQHVEG